MTDDIESSDLALKRRTRQATVVDCSGWVDTSAGDWTFGEFVTKKITRAASATNLEMPESPPDAPLDP